MYCHSHTLMPQSHALNLFSFVDLYINKHADKSMNKPEPIQTETARVRAWHDTKQAILHLSWMNNLFQRARYLNHMPIMKDLKNYMLDWTYRWWCWAVRIARRERAHRHAGARERVGVAYEPAFTYYEWGQHLKNDKHATMGSHFCVVYLYTPVLFDLEINRL